MPRQLTFERRAGEGITAHGRVLTPITRTWSMRSPGRDFRLTWNRPEAVLVREQNGQERILPIPDYTRRIILSLISACLGAAVLAWVVIRMKRR
jgi:hypothetical protein